MKRQVAVISKNFSRLDPKVADSVLSVLKDIYSTIHSGPFLFNQWYSHLQTLLLRHQQEGFIDSYTLMCSEDPVNFEGKLLVGSKEFSFAVWRQGYYLLRSR